MDHIPNNMRMAAVKMSNYSRNRFRLETTSNDNAKAGRIVTVNLPEGGAICDLKSFKMHMDVATTQATVGGRTVYGRLPADASSLISRVEVYLNGIQLMQGAAEYNTLCRLLKIGRSSRDKDSSIDRSLSHGAITMADAVEDVSVVMSDWKGFLGETSCRFIDTGLLGQLQVRLTFAGNEVLVPKETGVGIGTNLTDANARTAASQVEYSVSNIFFTIDTIQVDPMYSEMLRQRLSQEESISIIYKEYYTFSLDNITTGSHTTRFSLSSGSIDKMYATFRDSNHQTVGVKGHTMPAATFSDLGVSNAARFMSFDSATSRAGNLRYAYSINSVRHPQYRADISDALFDVAYVNNKVYDDSAGTMITAMSQFHEGMFMIPLLLNHPGEPIACKSGYDSRGINTNLTLEVSGQVPPTANAAAQTTASISSFILCETSSELKIGLGRSVAIHF